MRTAILVGVMAVVFSVVAEPAWADLSEKDVADVIKIFADTQPTKPAGKNFGQYPGVRWFRFVGLYEYAVDVTAHLCFIHAGDGPTLIPCKNLKKGYPLIAPLITWDD